MYRVIIQRLQFLGVNSLNSFIVEYKIGNVIMMHTTIKPSSSY